MKLGRMGREVIRWGPMPLGRDSEEKVDYVGGDPPWGESHLMHILGVPNLGYNTRKTSPLVWLEDWWD